MNKETHYWLTLVSVKLYKKHLEGFDFTYGENYWDFDWSEELSLEANLDNVLAEDNALTTFTASGVIESVRKENFYRNQQLESFADPARGHLVWGERWNEFDPAKREYDYLRIVDDFNWKVFLEFCNDVKLDYKQSGILASLELKNQVPIVHVGDEAYVLNTLQNGTTLDIIQAAYDHIDIRFSFVQLRAWTGKSFAAQNRFTDLFREGKNAFSNNGLLSPFAEINKRDFMLKKHVHLSQIALDAIRESRTN